MNNDNKYFSLFSAFVSVTDLPQTQFLMYRIKIGLRRTFSFQPFPPIG